MVKSDQEILISLFFGKVRAKSLKNFTKIKKLHFAKSDYLPNIANHFFVRSRWCLILTGFKVTGTDTRICNCFFKTPYLYVVQAKQIYFSFMDGEFYF